MIVVRKPPAATASRQPQPRNGYMAAAYEGDRPLCHVCLEGDDEAGDWLVHGGCGCRGSAGFGHLLCLVEAATHNPKSWTMCPTCRQRYTGPASLGLARARDEQGSTTATKAGVANALTDMGQFAEARRLYEEVLAGQTAQLGPAHTDTLVTKGNLATLLQKTGGWTEAQRLYEEVAAEQTAQLGPANSHTLLTKGNLACVLQTMGERAEAQCLYEEVAAGQSAQLGPAHIDTLTTKGNLTGLLLDLGERAEAGRMYEEVMAGEMALLKPGGCYMLTCSAPPGLHRGSPRGDLLVLCAPCVQRLCMLIAPPLRHQVADWWRSVGAVLVLCCRGRPDVHRLPAAWPLRNRPSLQPHPCRHDLQVMAFTLIPRLYRGFTPTLDEPRKLTFRKPLEAASRHMPLLRPPLQIK